MKPMVGPYSPGYRPPPEPGAANSYSRTTPKPDVSGSSASVELSNRAVNDVVLPDGVSELSLEFPESQGSSLRDFFLRLTSSEKPNVTVPEGETVEFGADFSDGLSAGLNVVLFTETAPNRWLVTSRSAQ
jgi:hypothetical protein